MLDPRRSLKQPESKTKGAARAQRVAAPHGSRLGGDAPSARSVSHEPLHVDPRRWSLDDAEEIQARAELAEDVTPRVSVPPLASAPPRRRSRAASGYQAFSFESTAPVARTLSEPVIPIQKPVLQRDLRTWAAAAAAALGLGLYGAAVLDLASMPASGARAARPAATLVASDARSPAGPPQRRELSTEVQTAQGLAAGSSPPLAAANHGSAVSHGSVSALAAAPEESPVRLATAAEQSPERAVRTRGAKGSSKKKAKARSKKKRASARSGSARSKR